MSLELYFVPPRNREFSKTLRAKALEGIPGPDYSGILYLAPTLHLRHRWEREFLSEGAEDGGCYIPPESKTLKGFSRGLYAEHGKMTLINKALVPLVISGISGATPGHAQKIAEFIAEMKDLVSVDTDVCGAARGALDAAFAGPELPEEVRQRAYDALKAMEDYERTMKARSMADTADAMIAAAALAAANVKPGVLVLEGFYEVTASELGLIKTLIGNSGKCLISIPISSPGDDLSHCYGNDIIEHFGVEPVTLTSPEDDRPLEFVAAPSREEELQGIARSIKSAFVSGTNRNLGEVFVAFPSMREYKETAQRVLGRYGIPFNFDEQGPVGATRQARDILALLDAAAGGFQRLPTARFLTSPSFPGIPEAIRLNTPGISLDAGTIRGRGAWMRAFTKAGKAGASKEAREVFSAIEPLVNSNKQGTYRYYLNLLLDVLRRLGFSSRSPGDEDGDEDKAGDGLSYVEAISGVGALDDVLGQETTLKGFAESLRAYLDALPSPADGPRTDGVVLGSLYELRGLEPERLYLGGLKDGDLPSKKEMDFILPDSIRTRMGLQDMQMHLRLQEYIFKRLTTASGNLRLSYPSMEGDKFFIPSLFISGGKEISEHLYGVFSEEEAQLRRGKTPLIERMGEIKSVKRFRKNSPMYVTDIDAYRSCPRRFYIERVLGLEPPEVLEFEVEARALGTIVHRVMEQLMGPPLVGLESFKARAETVIDAVLSDETLPDFLKTLIRESFMAMLPDIYALEEELASEGYSFWRSEYRVDSRLMPGVKLRGKIDRISIRDGSSSIVMDYKTGAAGLSSTRTLKMGATLQLFLYAAMLRQEGTSRPESVGIYSLKDIKLTRVPNKRDIKDGRGLEDFISVAMEFLGETVEAMRKGDFRALPMDEGFCRRCHERPYCPYIQGAANG